MPPAEPVAAIHDDYEGMQHFLAAKAECPRPSKGHMSHGEAAHHAQMAPCVLGTVSSGRRLLCRLDPETEQPFGYVEGDVELAAATHNPGALDTSVSNSSWFREVPAAEPENENDTVPPKRLEYDLGPDGQQQFH